MNTKNSSFQTAEPLCRNTVEQAKCYKSGTATRTAWHLNPVTSLSRRLVVGACANGDTRRCFYVLNSYVKQRTKHHVQDGRPMAELL